MEVKSTSPSRVIRFGVFQANLAARELRKHGVRVRLPGQPLSILSMLLERPGEIVTREEMRQRLWASDTFVDFEHSLNSAIKKLRTALGDSSENSQYVETVPRVGYRFIAPVENVSATPSEGTSTHFTGGSVGDTRAPEPTQRVSYRSRWVGWRLVLLTAALGLPLAFLGTHFLLPSPALPLQGKDVVVLADFENTTGDPVFNEALRQGLAVSLEQSAYVQLLPDRKSAVILKEMGRAPDERVTGQIAIELCQRAGSKVMVQGSISSLGTLYLVGLTAIRCDNSDAVAHEQSQAKRKEDVIGALGEAATQLRRRLGESMASIQKFNAPLEQVTTSSLEALKAYGVAVSTMDRNGDRAAIPLFEKAVQLDPSFAMAYGQLATIHRNMGEMELARENARKAFQYKERLTELERLVIESWFNIYVTGDLEVATQLYEVALQNYPPSSSILNDLGATYGSLGRYDKAAEILKQALRLDPDAAATYANLAASLLAVNRADEARSVLADANNHKLQTDSLLEVNYWNAFLQGNGAEMEAILLRAASVPGARAVLLSEQARTEAYFGHLERSRQISELAANVMEREGDKESAAACLAELAVHEAETGNSARARAHALNSLQRARSQTVVTLAALVMTQIGDVKRAEKLAEGLSRKYSSDTLLQKYWLPTIFARAELRQGKWSKAIDNLSVAAPFDFATPPTLSVSTLYPAYVRGEAYLAAGDGNRAAAEYGKLIDRPGMVLNSPLGALARLGRARAYALLGDSRAQNFYREFLDLWKGADASLPVLRQARAEYSKLR